MAERPLDGRVVVVTGGGGGLGTALGRAFVAAGASVALLDIDVQAATRAADAVAAAARVITVACDVADPTACERAVSQVAERLGPPDIVVVNAGLTHRSAVADTEIEVVRRVMEVNYFGAINITKAALPGLVERGGAVGVISSVAGLAPLIGRSGYAASKHALHGFFGTLRAELRGTGVDVTIVAPSFIDTPFRHRTLDGDGTITTHPQSRVGKMLTADDAAARVVRAVQRRRKLVVLGTVGKVTRYLAALAPGLYERIMARSLRSELDR